MFFYLTQPTFFSQTSKVASYSYACIKIVTQMVEGWYYVQHGKSKIILGISKVKKYMSSSCWLLWVELQRKVEKNIGWIFIRTVFSWSQNAKHAKQHVFIGEERLKLWVAKINSYMPMCVQTCTCAMRVQKCLWNVRVMTTFLQ